MKQDVWALLDGIRNARLESKESQAIAVYNT